MLVIRVRLNLQESQTSVVLSVVVFHFCEKLNGGRSSQFGLIRKPAVVKPSLLNAFRYVSFQAGKKQSREPTFVFVAEAAPVLAYEKPAFAPSCAEPPKSTPL